MPKKIKEIFFRMCFFVYFNLQIIFVLSCMIIGGVVGWFLAISASFGYWQAIVISFVFGGCGFMIGGIIITIHERNCTCHQKEKTKKAMPVQNETIKKSDKMPVDCGPACKDCDINKGTFCSENLTFYCIGCDGGNPMPSEGESED